MPNPITRLQFTQSLAGVIVAASFMPATVSADAVRPELNTATAIATAVFALVDPREPLKLYGLSPDRPSHVTDVLQGKPFKADCATLSKTTVDLMRRAGVTAWVIKVTLPPMAPCKRAIVNGRLTCSLDHSIAAYVDGKITMAVDIRRAAPVPLDDLLRNSMYRVSHGGR